MKINIINWCKVTAFKAVKTFIQTFIAALTVSGAGVSAVDLKSALWISVGAAIACFGMYFGKLQWEINSKKKFKIFAVLDEEKVTDEKLQEIAKNALEQQSTVKKKIIEKEEKQKSKDKTDDEEETKEDSSPSLKGKIYLSPSNQTENKYKGIDTNEAEQCEKIAAKLKDILVKKGLEVMIAERSENMEKRCKNSDEFKSDLHIPIHTNASNGTVGGTRVFFFSEESKEIAKTVYNSIYELTPGGSDNLSKVTDLYELHHTDAPGVYVEVEFHDVEAYAEWITKHTDDIAEHLAKGIENVFKNCEIKKGIYTQEVAKEEAKQEEAAQPTGDNFKKGNCICQIGKDYVLLCNLKVRDGAGTNFRQKLKSELTPDGQAHAIDDTYACLQEGTGITCLAIDENWIQIPSGWICARDIDGTDYVKDMPQENPKVAAIRGRLAAWSDPYNQGYPGWCQAWVQTLYHEAGLNSPTYCCASNNRDHNASPGDPQNGDMVFAGTGYHNIIDDVCGRYAGHVGIYMDGMVYGSQIPYAQPFDKWVAVYGYGGHSNQGNWQVTT